jgi:hypothetical protein
VVVESRALDPSQRMTVGSEKDRNIQVAISRSPFDREERKVLPSAGRLTNRARGPLLQGSFIRSGVIDPSAFGLQSDQE